MPTKPETLTITGTPMELEEALTTLVNIRQPGCTWGPPGIGKSDLVRHIADTIYASRYGLDYDGTTLRDQAGQEVTERPYLVDLRVALMDPVDLMGMPSIIDGVAGFVRPRWFPTDERGGILLLDEITRGSVMVMNALLQLTLDRRMGEHSLPAQWTVLAASNRLSDGGGVTKMPLALAERFAHLHMEPDLDEWTQWAIAHDVHPLVIAFVRFKPDLFCQQAANEMIGTNPRSWWMASRILKTNPTGKSELMLLAGVLGVGVAGEVAAFIRNFKACPSIDAIIMDPLNALVPGRTEPSSLFAVASALARRMDDQNAENIGLYLERMPTEYAAFSWKDATARDISLSHTNAFNAFVIAHPEIT